MSGFFDSKQVRESLTELEELQGNIFNDLLSLPFFDLEQKKEHLDKMKLFLEKQKNFVFRLSLSDDPEAIEMKNRIIESAQMFGMKKTDSLNVFFEKMEESIQNLEKILDK